MVFDYCLRDVTITFNANFQTAYLETIELQNYVFFFKTFFADFG